ncbi:MAG: carboxypeptidase regulatory-like domain-containing protein [Gemmatimonadales bacterium]
MLHLLLLLALQAPPARVVGVVRDEATGEPLAGALVSLPDLDRTTSTDAGGRYVLPDVPPGPQHILVRFIGHTQHALHALVPAGGTLEIDVTLRAEPVRLGTIQVRSPPAIRGLEGADSAGFPDRSMTAAAIRNHPLLAQPDVFEGLSGGEVAVEPESPSGVHIRGGESDQTGYLLDGIPVFNPYHAAGTFSAWNPDAISAVRLSSSLPPPEYPAALAGTIVGQTRAPGALLSSEGSLSTTQARFTLDGPLGGTGAGFLVSLRTAFPGSPTPSRDPSYLTLGAGDWLAKLEAPLLGGRVRLLGYNNENELEAAAVANEPPPGTPRNGFEWNASSAGIEWNRVVGRFLVNVTGWSAGSDAESRWDVLDGGMRLSASRRDLGLAARAEVRSGKTRTQAGVRLERSRTSYEVDDRALAATTPVASLFGQHTRPLGDRTDLTVGAVLAAADGGAHLGPSAQLRWRVSPVLGLSASVNRTHQFAQSLRNSESVVGNVFPVDLFIGAGAPGVPTARSDQAAVAADYRPSSGVRIGAQVFHRASSGLLLVAPRVGGPFGTESFAVGSGDATGMSVEAAVSGARFGLLGSYGIQQVSLTYPGASYTPGHGTTHLLEGGAIVFPAATLSVRIGATAAFGRRTTTTAGGFEWEACNLLDQGCEFSGTPTHADEPLGATGLPAYFRVDLGVRKHWHFHLGGRDAMVGLFGTVTNLFNRKNVLTFTRDPSTGELAPVEMRPFAPLLLGLDWRF